MSDPKHALSMIRLAIIGGGQMARGLIGGLVARGLPARQITVSEPMAESRAQLERDFGVQVTADNAGAVSGAQVVILAVKPQGMAEVASALAHVFAAASPLIISVAAGIRAVDLARWCGGHVAVVRAMPNRPALVGAGATGLYAHGTLGAEQRAQAENLMAATGLALWVDNEAQLDAVTALSGSGPAYFFLLAELMAASGERLGLSAATARQLAAQTLHGAGQLATPGADLAALRASVTSKGGTTAAALAAFDAAGLPRIVAEAMDAAAHRSRELAEQFGVTR